MYIASINSSKSMMQKGFELGEVEDEMTDATYNLLVNDTKEKNAKLYFEIKMKLLKSYVNTSPRDAMKRSKWKQAPYAQN